ncbi:hypothetical protein [Paenibacillus sp. Mc5Re-14]|uniref:hypothetical protein n=1 Tax=Paenibacillus sp. Mc5Re-14 TaxID=1030529 RepID=UPI000B155EA9|nr:hypothetical protein [Paenibacillus sp. Mc5Re-14]
MDTRYIVTKVTELDRVTPKTALPEQNMDYDLVVKCEYAAHFNPYLGRSMVLIPTKPNDDINSMNIYTSSVFSIEDNGDELIVVTRNTVYYFEKREVGNC